MIRVQLPMPDAPPPPPLVAKTVEMYEHQGGGFKMFQIFFIFTPIWGNETIWRAYFSDGLKPPTRHGCFVFFFTKQTPTATTTAILSRVVIDMDRQIYHSHESYGLGKLTLGFFFEMVGVCVCVCDFFKAEVRMYEVSSEICKLSTLDICNKIPAQMCVCLFFSGLSTSLQTNTANKPMNKRLVFQVLDSWQLLRMNLIIRFSWQDGCYVSDLPWNSDESLVFQIPCQLVFGPTNTSLEGL